MLFAFSLSYHNSIMVSTLTKQLEYAFTIKITIIKMKENLENKEKNLENEKN
jgi:hypothetical protein